MKKLIDLHIHSNLSDGMLSPKEIVDVASNNNVTTISIADHDTLLAYNDELFDYAAKKGIKIIPAVEISTKYNGKGIHVLGYNFDINNNELKDRLYRVRNVRHIYLHDVSLKLKEYGYLVDVFKLDKIDAVTKAHIALDVIENTNNTDLLLKDFGHIPSKGEFIETIMNENCPCYVEKESISPVEASEIIKKAKGKVILAHPVACKYEDGLNTQDILSLVREMKADGIESNYIYIDRNNNSIDEVNYWNDFARSHNLITTIGSDFHNDDGIHPNIGLIGEAISLNDNDIENILNKLLEV